MTRERNPVVDALNNDLSGESFLVGNQCIRIVDKEDEVPAMRVMAIGLDVIVEFFRDVLAVILVPDELGLDHCAGARTKRDLR